MMLTYEPFGLSNILRGAPEVLAAVADKAGTAQAGKLYINLLYTQVSLLL